ncbi:MAG: carboxylating nicotinate-nucleotide diphosphorylase [Cyclobacteriaceae bacterium]|nr:carboxylating nicotinate-nucleotide diphosphorylase [Cyclobacteriaceae bacterium]
MIPPYINKDHLIKLLRDAIAEDIGDGDHSSYAIFPEGKTGKARLITKEGGVIAGLYVADLIFRIFDGKSDVRFLKNDGDPVTRDEILFEVEGSIRAILSAERLTLNILQRMSGIATATNRLVKKIENYPVKLLDTRKTTPNLRMLEKWAVKLGGAENHRMGLYDMIMLKDNHIDFAGGISPAIRAVKNYLVQTGKSLKIEIETRNLREVREVLDTGGVDVIMLDNMGVQDMKNAVRMINGKYATEASGNITEENIEKIAASGVDFISVGAITHSVKSLDISLKTLI